MLQAPQHKHTIIFLFVKSRVVSELFVECWATESWILRFLQVKNSTTEHDTVKLTMLFHSEPTAHSNDIKISYYEKIPKICEIPLFHKI